MKVSMIARSLAVALFLTLCACGNPEGLPIGGPVARITDQSRLPVMADDIWPGIEEGSEFVDTAGYTGGLRMVSFVCFTDPGSVANRMSVHVMEVPGKTTSDQILTLIGKVMREGMQRRGWNAVRDGSETFSMRGGPATFERYAVVSSDDDGHPTQLSMYLLARPVGDALGVLIVTGHENSFERPKTVQNLHAFLAATPAA